MKGKIIRGSGFGGVLKYVLDPSKNAYVVASNMTGRDAKSLAKEFAPMWRLRPDCKKPVLHIPLRLPAGEDVSDEQWQKIILTLFKLMRLSTARPWTLVKHLGEHVHLVTGRVDYQGKIWTGEWEALRLIEATQQIEKLFGLTITPGLRGGNRKQARLTSGQLRKMQREVDRGEVPEVPIKVQIAERIQRAITESNGTFEDFKERLEKLGVAVKLNTAKTTNHVSGIIFECEGIAMKGSKIARAYSWQGITQLLNERKDDNENPGITQPSISHCPQSNECRTDQPIIAGNGQRCGAVGERPAKGGVSTSPLLSLAVSDNANGAVGITSDLLLSILGGAPVAASVGTVANAINRTTAAIISATGKAGASPKRDSQNIDADNDEPGDNAPTIGF